MSTFLKGGTWWVGGAGGAGGCRGEGVGGREVRGLTRARRRGAGGAGGAARRPPPPLGRAAAAAAAAAAPPPRRRSRRAWHRKGAEMFIAYTLSFSAQCFAAAMIDSGDTVMKKPAL